MTNDFILPDDGDVSISGRPKSKSCRNKNAKQLAWVLLLKAHKAAGCLTSIAAAFLSISSAVRRRVAFGRIDTDNLENSTVRRRFYSCIKVFLWLSLMLLGFEIAVYYKGWHFGTPDFQLQYLYTLISPLVVKDPFDSLYSSWVLIRVDYLAPPLQFLANACIIVFLIKSFDRLVLSLGCFWIRFKKIKPVLKGPEDLESGDSDLYLPMVLVQIPTCNEKEVYQQSIAAVCNLDLPKSNLLIQVLDDLDDPTTQLLIKDKVHKWQQEGANILYQHRVIREGYKAGNLKSAMNCSYVKNYEFVAIFYADFQPISDFLKKIVPHFKDMEHSRKFLGTVQTNEGRSVKCVKHGDQYQDIGGVYINSIEETGSHHYVMIDNLEKDLSPTSIMEFIHKQTSISAQAYVLPSLSEESYTRGAIVLDSKAKLKHIYEFLVNPDHIIISSTGRWKSQRNLPYILLHIHLKGCI